MIMPNLDAVDNALQFIERHLRSDISIADVAESVFYSLYHFSRVFNRSVHHTPYDYIMRRRLSEAGRELLKSDRKVIDIAFEFQFNSHESFSRAFRRMFECNPQEWRKQKSVDPRLFMPPLSHSYLQHLHTSLPFCPVSEELSSLQIAGLMTQIQGNWQNNFKLIGHLWDQVNHLYNHWKNVHLNVFPEFYGISFYPDKWEKYGWFYMAGIKVTPGEHIPEGFVLKDFPARHSTCFFHNAPLEMLPMSFDFIYHTWAVKNQIKPVWEWELVRYGNQFPVPGERPKAGLAVYIPTP